MRLATLLLLILPIMPEATGQQASCEDGFAAGFPCSRVDLLGHIPLFQMHATSASDIWGWTDPDTGKEYALIALFHGTYFVDVSVPTDPVRLGLLPTHTSSFGGYWRDVKVYADHAFVVSEAEDHGVQVFDLTELRGVAAPQLFSETAHYDGVGSAHNIAINEATGFAYVVGAQTNSGPVETCAGGLHIVNIQDPANPAFAGCFAEDGYTHDVQCVVYDGPDTDYTGREICIASNEDTFTIVDVTDKGAPVMLSQAVYPNVGYTHQGWLTEDHRYFIGNDESDESTFNINTRTLVFDVADLDEPEFLDAFVHDTPAIDHNLFVKGRYVYESNYRAGLRVLDAEGLLAGDGAGSGLEAVAYFDTYPADNDTGFDGTWSNYPFFESGIVVVSDINGGLFVLQPQLPDGNPTDAADTAAPGTYALTEAYPNPFSARTQFELTLGEAQDVDVAVFDVLGRRVADLFHGTLGAGEQRTFVFDGRGVPAGLYFVRFTGEGFAETRQVSLAR